MSDTPDLRALHEAATILRDRYVANRGSKHEFVVTMTDQGGELRHQWQNLTNALDASGHPIPRERPLPEVEEALDWFWRTSTQSDMAAKHRATLRSHIATLQHDLAVARDTARLADELADAVQTMEELLCIGCGEQCEAVSIIATPWSQEQVDGLNSYQRNQHFHPYTCGNDSSHALLVATKYGWVCPDCGYKQTWAHVESIDVASIDFDTHQPRGERVVSDEKRMSEESFAAMSRCYDENVDCSATGCVAYDDCFLATKAAGRDKTFEMFRAERTANTRLQAENEALEGAHHNEREKRIANGLLVMRLRCALNDAYFWMTHEPETDAECDVLAKVIRRTHALVNPHLSTENGETPSAALSPDTTPTEEGR